MRKIEMIVAVLTLSCAVSFADTITFSTPAGSTGTGATGMVSAQATVTTGTGMVTIQLWNTLGGANSITNAGQLLSDFSVTLGSSPGTVASGKIGGTGNTFSIDGTGAASAVTSGVSLGWGVSASANTISLNGLGGANTPKDLLVGLPCASGSYCNGNGSINANPGHNPFAQNGATFTIGATGVTSTTAINSAVFSFGTTAGDNVDGKVVPEPASLLLFGTGLLGLGLLVRRKYSHAA